VKGSLPLSLSLSPFLDRYHCESLLIVARKRQRQTGRERESEKEKEKQRKWTQRDSINQGINRVVINVSSARGYAKDFRSEEIDLPGKSTTRIFITWRQTSGIEKNVDQVGTPARYVRCVYQIFAITHGLFSSNLLLSPLLSLSLSLSLVACSVLNTFPFHSGTCFGLRPLIVRILLIARDHMRN